MFHNSCFHFWEPQVPDDGNTRQPGKSYRIIPNSGVVFAAVCDIRGLMFVLVPSIALARNDKLASAVGVMEIDAIKSRNQDDATGFIRLNALRPASGIASKVQRKRGG
jgi:hypothetical protein